MFGFNFIGFFLRNSDHAEYESLEEDNKEQDFC